MPRKTNPQPCACGCGEMTGGGKFKPGHDARLYAAILDHIDGDVTDLATIVELHTGSEIRLAGEAAKRSTEANALRSAADRMPKRKGTIGTLCVDLLKNEVDDDVIIQEVLARFPRSRFQQTHVSYYRSILRASGVN